MALFKPRTWGLIRVWRDIENYKDFIRVIKREEQDPKSKFNKWKLKRNYFFTIYFTYDIEESETQIPEQAMRLRMIESMAPLHLYLDEELGFAECLTPSFNRFYDSEEKPTLTFLITYRFSFNKLSFWWVIKFLMKWAILIIGITIALKNGLLIWLQGLI